MTSTTYQENHTLYASADNAPGFDPDRAKLLGNWLKDISTPARSLDIGCASGGFSGLLPDDVEKWGVDFQRHPKLSEKFVFKSGDISEPWPIPKTYFDIVLAGEIIEHVLDTDAFLTQCFESLAVGGYLLLTTPNLVSFANLRYWFKTDQYMWVDSGSNQMGHVRYLAPSQMKIALQMAGFVDIQMASSSGLESLDRLSSLQNLLRKAFPLRGNRLCVMARKPVEPQQD